MYQIGICDDEQSIREKIRGVVEEYAAESGRAFSCVEYESASHLLSRYQSDLDILFLDISMQGLDGMRAARELRKMDTHVRIIFVTSMQQYAVEGYKVRAFGFITKPIHRQELLQELDGALHSIDTQRLRESTITLRSGTSMDRLSVSDILYCEVMNHTAQLHLYTEVRSYRCQMKALEEQLSGYGFFRPHSAYLVNYTAIAQILGNKLVLKNGVELPISQHKRKDFLAQLARYAGGQL